MSENKKSNSLLDRVNLSRRKFLKTTAATGAALAGGGLIELKTAKEANAFAYEPYPKDDQLETVVTSCAHNCGSRHMLVAHKWKDVIVRLSTDDGRYQRGGHYSLQLNISRVKTSSHNLVYYIFFRNYSDTLPIF